MVTGWKLAVMFASYGGRLEARGLNDLIVYGRQYTLFITTSQGFTGHHDDILGSLKKNGKN